LPSKGREFHHRPRRLRHRLRLSLLNQRPPTLKKEATKSDVAFNPDSNEKMNSTPTRMPVQLSPSEQLTYSTVRIESLLRDGTAGVGTGFFFSFLREGNRAVPALVTNKHVIEGALKGRFLLHIADQDGNPQIGSNVPVELDNFEARWISHPDSSVDLCIMPIAPLFQEAKQKGKQVFFKSFDEDLVPTPDDVQGFVALEEVVMIGYPIGIWDSKKNMPVVWRGVTATNVAIDYEGRQEFLIDAACFPGSSGSPVFLFNIGGYSMKTGGFVIGSRIKLLGVLYAGPQYTAEGELVVVNVPTQKKVMTASQIPINLGICVKAKRLLEFEPILKPRAEKSQDA
jgi:hypothetical protein